MPTFKQAAITRGPTGYHNLPHTCPTESQKQNDEGTVIRRRRRGRKDDDDDDELQGLLIKKKDATKA
jgi:hypothetical protein